MTQEIKGHDNPSVLIVDKEKKTRNRKPKATDLDSVYRLAKTLTMSARVDLIRQLRKDIAEEVDAAKSAASFASELASGI